MVDRPHLHYAIEGNGENVVLLHPVGLDLHCWDAITRRLADRYRFLKVDLRGFGESPQVNGEPELADYAFDVHELVTRLDFAPSAMVGLSFGGMVAQEYALSFPARLSKIVVAACPCTLPVAVRETLSQRGKAALLYGMGPLLEETLQRWFTPRFIDSEEADVVRARLSTTDPRAWNSAWHAISNVDTASRLHAIRMPALCIAGELDAAAPPAALMDIVRRVPHAQLVVLPETPHMMQLERPERLADALTAFL